MKDDETHIQLGEEHAREGLPRHKYQDRRLQVLYDRGYDRVAHSMDLPPGPEYTRTHCRACGRTMYNTASKYCNNCL